MNRSVIFDTTVRLVFDSALVLSVYLLFAGHNQPGGGFVGGLVAAGAFSLRYIAGGLAELERVVRVRPWSFLAIGLVLVAATAAAPVLSGHPPLDHAVLSVDLPVIGPVKTTTAAVFDTGIYFVVIGMVLMIFEALDGEQVVEPAGGSMVERVAGRAGGRTEGRGSR